MKIVQINAVYGHGSTGTIVKNIEQLCLSNDIECIVASPDPAVINAKYGYRIGNVIDHKIHALLCRIGGKQAYYSKSATNKFLKFLDSEKPDIVHLHNLHGNYINLNILLRYLAERKIVTIATMHDCWFFTGGCFHYANAGCYRWIDTCGNCPKKMQDTKAYIYDASSYILNDRRSFLNAISKLVMIGCSDWISGECRKSLLEATDIRTIHNGFDLDKYKHVQSDWRERLDIVDKYVLLAPASKWLLPENKQTFDYFVKEMPRDFVLVLFGCKDMSGECPSNVRKVGFVRDPYKMAEVYSMADVLVNCSREDTLSSLNLEAQACGTPVVTYDSTGLKETIFEGFGFAVEDGNPQAMLQRVLDIKNNRPLSKYNECIAWLKREFDILQNYMRYIELYREMYNKP